MPQKFNIAVIGGDGIGPEVIEAALPILETAASKQNSQLQWDRLPYGAEHFLKTEETLPEAAFEKIRDTADAVFLGALGDPRVPGNEHARDILLGLRFKLDLYVNFRPCVLIHPDLCPLKEGPDGPLDIDFVIFRENTEGSYLGRGTEKDVGTPDEEQIAEEVHTARKVERIIRAAFEWAKSNGRGRVTMSDKSNAIPAHRLWGRLFKKIGEEFPDIDQEHRYVDALAMELVRDPERFDVIVTSNLFGDILSDLGAELVGGLGVAASANLHPGRPGLFEPVHGSAPPLVGTGQANPIAAILTGASMLGNLGLNEAQNAVEHAVKLAFQERMTTPDLGGKGSTQQVADWIHDQVRSA